MDTGFWEWVVSVLRWGCFTDTKIIHAPVQLGKITPSCYGNRTLFRMVIIAGVTEIPLSTTHCQIIQLSVGHAGNLNFLNELAIIEKQ